MEQTCKRVSSLISADRIYRCPPLYDDDELPGNNVENSLLVMQQLLRYIDRNITVILPFYWLRSNRF